MDEWYVKLQKLLRQAVEGSTPQDWLRENSYIFHDIQGAEEFEVERFESEQDELRIYARVGESIISPYQVQQVIYKVLHVAAEHFLVLIPLHTPQVLQFWFITGSQSHGHVVRIIVERDKHPHIQGD